MSQSALTDNLRIGKVIEIDLEYRVARVSIGDMLSGWIEFATARAGKTKVWLPPSVGEQVEIISPDGDLEGAYIGQSLYSDANPPPSNKPGAFILFEDGTFISYDPETHELEAILCAGGKATITAPAGLTINGDVTVNGKIDATGDVKAGNISLQQHKHGGVQAGGGQSGVPL